MASFSSRKVKSLSETALKRLPDVDLASFLWNEWSEPDLDLREVNCLGKPKMVKKPKKKKEKTLGGEPQSKASQ